MEERYHRKMSAYIRKLERLDCSETQKLHIIAELIHRKTEKICELWQHKLDYISRQYNDVEVLTELAKDIINKVNAVIPEVRHNDWRSWKNVTI